MRKIAIIPVVIGMLVMAAGVGLLAAMSTIGPENPSVAYNTSNNFTDPEAYMELPLERQDVTGTWIVDGGNGSTLTAIVRDQTIEIVMERADTSLTYWFGTFRDSAEIGEMIDSIKIDVSKPVMSQSDEKMFTIYEDRMTFDFTAMGKTQTLELRRV
jgi:hypothetical protein